MGKKYQLISKQKNLTYIIKANGQTVPFDYRKVIATCRRAGANRNLARKVAHEVNEQIHEGMSTRQIYKLVLSTLSSFRNEKGNIISLRCRLKEAIMQLGPSGFPFERYVSRILESHGYQIESIRALANGQCIKHEIDIVAYMPESKKKCLVECKYHNFPGIFTGLKESLYTHARFIDLVKIFDGEILVCNTKISKEAITYATCIGQQVISWRYPQNTGLEKMIQEKGLYPLTILPLNKQELMAFSSGDIMVAKDLDLEDPVKLTSKTGIPLERIKKLQDLARQIITRY